MNSEIGVIGLGVMGKSLSRNLARNGFGVSLYNRHVDGLEEDIAINFKAQYPELKKSFAFDDLKAFVQSMALPRKIILMVNAGPAVDAVLNDLCNVLDAGDIVIDGGNSHFEETKRRINLVKEIGLLFIGTGVSGGEKGALNGPSIMPSGDKQAYMTVSKYLESISAKDSDGRPCCTYVGREGSGHFVKMIHNGIEYAEMQLIAECYSILKNQNLSNEEIADTFSSWMNDHGSYLLSITIDILRKKEGNEYLLDKILDKAGNKGTGKWATGAIADSGEPATMIPAALFARYLSFFKDKRQDAYKAFDKTYLQVSEISINELKEAYQFSRIINHHQGFSVIESVSRKNEWNVDMSEIARIWTEGCIIKSDFMKNLVEILKEENSILLSKSIIPKIQKNHSSIISVVNACLQNGIHIPCLVEAVNFFHGIKTPDCSANVIQAQRDYFGAHTYKRKNDSTGKSYHTQW